MKNCTYPLIVILFLSILFSCSDHESEIDMNNCIKARIVSVGRHTAVIDILVLPPLCTQAYKDSVHPNVTLEPALSIGNIILSERLEEGGGMLYRYNFSSLKAYTTYSIKVNVPIYLGNGKDCLQLNPGSSGWSEINLENNTFTTPPDLTPVDLGLSVLWSENDWGRNVGDNSTFASFNWSVNPITGLPPYNNISGTDEDPVASEMGDGWRMPTTAEMQELIDNCNWSTWHSQNIISGKVTMYFKRVVGKGAFSDNYIKMFPSENCSELNFVGTYWTADVASENSSTDQFKVNCLLFDDLGQRIKAMPYTTNTTYLIRPVKDR